MRKRCPAAVSQGPPRRREGEAVKRREGKAAPATCAHLGEAAPRGQAARGELGRSFFADLGFHPFDDVARDRHAGTARFAAQHVRRCEHDVPAVRRKVFFAHSRKSTPISNPLEQRPVALEAPLPGFNDQTE
jgi:hypothetical protein